MNAKTLKWIAIITMTLDHIGFFLIPDGWLNDVFRGIGRIAFPLFAFLIAQGYEHTHHFGRYILRLGIAAVVMELAVLIIYLVSGEAYFITINVFIPLLAGLLSLWLIHHRNPYYKWLIIPLLVLCEWGGVSYGMYGVLMILAFGLLPKKHQYWTALIILNLFFNEWPLFTYLATSYDTRYEGWLQWLSLLALVPIQLYNGQKGTYNKWFFYLYYPLHIGIIVTIQLLIA